MYEDEMDPASIIEDTERTRLHIDIPLFELRLVLKVIRIHKRAKFQASQAFSRKCPKDQIWYVF